MVGSLARKGCGSRPVELHHLDASAPHLIKYGKIR
jgi:hypothetical protein